MHRLLAYEEVEPSDELVLLPDPDIAGDSATLDDEGKELSAISSPVGECLGLVGNINYKGGFQLKNAIDTLSSLKGSPKEIF